jgi:hypothetical protein
MDTLNRTPIPGDAAALPVSLDSVLITSAIDAYEGRDVSVVDVPDTKINAYMDGEVIMTLWDNWLSCIRNT